MLVSEVYFGSGHGSGEGGKWHLSFKHYLGILKGSKWQPSDNDQSTVVVLEINAFTYFTPTHCQQQAFALPPHRTIETVRPEV